MNKCNKCEIEKDESEFWVNKRTKTGFEYICKVCLNATRRARRTPTHLEKEKEWREKNQDKVSQYAKNWRENNPERYNELQRESYERCAEQRNEKRRETYAKNHHVYHASILRQRAKEDWHEKNNARSILNQHLSRGNIERPENCQICSSKKKLDAHHHDYTKPLEVIWVCRKCHKKIHMELENGS